MRKQIMMLAILGIALAIQSCKKSPPDNPVYAPYNENGMWGYTPDLFPTDLDWKSGKSLGMGYIDKSGNMVIPEQFSLAYDFSYDLAHVAKEVEGVIKHGFCDRSGAIQVPLVWNNCGKFTADGLAWVKNSEGKYGFVDRQGNLVIPCQYDLVYHFHDGLAAVKINDKVGYCNTSGTMVIPANYESSLMFNEGLAPVFSSAGKSGFIDAKNNLIIDYIYDHVNPFINGLAAVKKNNKYGFIRPDGTVAIDFLYDEAGSFWEGIAAVKTNEKYGFIDQAGKVIIPFQFEYVSDFSEGMAAVKKDGLWGYTDNTGTLKIAPQYKDADDFTNGITWVVFLDDTFGYIDKNSTIIWKQPL